jgi:hypothetical protein
VAPAFPGVRGTNGCGEYFDRNPDGSVGPFVVDSSALLNIGSTSSATFIVAFDGSEVEVGLHPLSPAGDLPAPVGPERNDVQVGHRARPTRQSVAG